MTSPAQLKYLDAIGIPIWVSRDLVINPVQDDVGLGTSLQSTPQKQVAVSASATHGHVDHLLHDLDVQFQQQSPRKINKPSQIREPAQLHPQSQPQTQTNKQAEVSKQATEIGRTSLHTIYACGDLNADWMIIGEAPELSTNGQGQPFAGDSGILLTNMLRAVGIEEPRREAYLVNMLKNSNEDDGVSGDVETEKLNQLLIEKITQVAPKIIFLVGQIAAQNLLKSKEPLVRLRGKKHILQGLQIPMIVSYYPSYLLSKPIDKRKAWEDLKLAMRSIESSD